MIDWLCALVFNPVTMAIIIIWALFTISKGDECGRFDNEPLPTEEHNEREDKG